MSDSTSSTLEPTWFSSRAPYLISSIIAVGGGVSWLIGHLLAKPLNYTWFAQLQAAIPTIVTTLGVIASTSIAVIIAMAWRHSRSVSQKVNAQTAELTRAKEKISHELMVIRGRESHQLQQQEILRGLMENSPGIIFVKDREGRYLAVNRRFAKLYERDESDILGRTDYDLIHPAAAAQNRSTDMRVITSGLPIELEDAAMLSDEGRTLLVHKFPLRDIRGEVVGLCGLAQDITERKRAASDLRESRRQLESLLGQLPGMAFRWVNDGAFSPVYVSRGSLTLTGHTARDFMEKHVDFLNIVHDEDRSLVRDHVKDALSRHRSFEHEFRMKDRSGAIKWALLRGQGIYDEHSRLLFVEGLAIDITARKEAESEKLNVERRLQEAQKLESIGVLAGGIAHDFNNLLTSIIGHSNLVGLDLPAEAPAQRNLRYVEQAALRAAELCQQMLAYSGQGRFVVGHVEIKPLVESTVSLLRASIDKSTNLIFSLDVGLPQVYADATQLRQVVMNLVINASEALEHKNGSVLLSARRTKVDRQAFAGAVLTPPETNDEFILLEVTDTGCGMSAETLAKIFDPFFTTKITGRGLGLAATIGILRSHQGGLIVTSTQGKGTTFSVYLPAASIAASETEALVKPDNSAWKGRGFALVVDDEDHVLDATAKMISNCGLKVDVAHDGYAGVDLFRADPSRYDVVLLDMTMPKISGEDTLTLLREIRPDVRVLFISGYNRSEIVDTMGGSERLSFIQKPFNLDALRGELANMLN